MSVVLVVDDEPPLLRALQITLTARGHDVHTAASGRRAIAEATARPPDLVILDLGLPDIDGGEVIHRLREHSTVPIIVLSGRTSGGDKVAALDAGADDYVTKPFGIEELLARIRAVTRRAVPDDPAPAFELGDYLVDLGARRVSARGVSARVGDSRTDDGRADDSRADDSRADDSRADDGRADVRLTPTEWRLLDALARHPGKLIARQQLITDVWGPVGSEDSSSLRFYLNRLRRKLEPDPSRPRHLITEPGMGYRFQP